MPQRLALLIERRLRSPPDTRKCNLGADQLEPNQIPPTDPHARCIGVLEFIEVIGKLRYWIGAECSG